MQVFDGISSLSKQTYKYYSKNVVMSQCWFWNAFFRWVWGLHADRYEEQQSHSGLLGTTSWSHRYDGHQNYHSRTEQGHDLMVRSVIWLFCTLRAVSCDVRNLSHTFFWDSPCHDALTKALMCASDIEYIQLKSCVHLSNALVTNSVCMASILHITAAHLCVIMNTGKNPEWSRISCIWLLWQYYNSKMLSEFTVLWGSDFSLCHDELLTKFCHWVTQWVTSLWDLFFVCVDCVLLHISSFAVACFCLCLFWITCILFSFFFLQRWNRCLIYVLKSWLTILMVSWSWLLLLVNGTITSQAYVHMSTH